MTEPSKRICISCIHDLELTERLLPKSHEIECDYCGEEEPGLTILDLAKEVDPDLRSFCQKGELMPVVSRGTDFVSHEMEGDPLASFLQDEMSVDLEVSEDLVSQLADLESGGSHDAGNSFYESDSNYHRRHLGSKQHDQIWQEFSYRIKHQRRFFDQECRNLLAEILGESVIKGDLPVLKLGIDTEIKHIYRARCAPTEEAALRFVEDPQGELGPPPAELATSGRMNSAGIPVLYGAFSPDTAIAEIRPSVGGLVVVGAFVPNKTLRVLDLSRIGGRFTGSIFAPEYQQRASQARFLEGFHHRIARPIQPTSEPLEYISTQAVAEYVANVLGLDGILYASAQVGALPDLEDQDPSCFARGVEYQFSGGHNVVLFGKASHIQNENGGTLAVATSTTAIRKITQISFAHEREFLFPPEGMLDKLSF